MALLETLFIRRQYQGACSKCGPSHCVLGDRTTRSEDAAALLRRCRRLQYTARTSAFCFFQDRHENSAPERKKEGERDGVDRNQLKSYPTNKFYTKLLCKFTRSAVVTTTIC